MRASVSGKPSRPLLGCVTKCVMCVMRTAQACAGLAVIDAPVKGAAGSRGWLGGIRGVPPRAAARGSHARAWGNGARARVLRCAVCAGPAGGPQGALCPCACACTCVCVRASWAVCLRRSRMHCVCVLVCCVFVWIASCCTPSAWLVLTSVCFACFALSVAAVPGEWWGQRLSVRIPSRRPATSRLYSCPAGTRAAQAHLSVNARSTHSHPSNL